MVYMGGDDPKNQRHNSSEQRAAFPPQKNKTRKVTQCDLPALRCPYAAKEEESKPGSRGARAKKKHGPSWRLKRS